MRNLYTRRLPLIVLLAAAAVWVVLPNNPGIHLFGMDKDIEVVRGLDLQGGLRVLLEADLPEQVEVTSEQLQTVRRIIEDRVNGLGVTEPVVQVAGSRRILVELPGIGDTEQAVDTIKETALLEFVEITREDLIQLSEGSTVRTDYGQVEVDPVEEPNEDPVLHTVMTGADLEDARVIQDQTGGIAVAFELTEEGADIFSEYTRQNIGEILGIALDKELISTPRINSHIPTGEGIIQGNFTLEEANRLAVQLRYGSLPVPLRIAESKIVGPSLGQDSLRKSGAAGVIGMAVVMVFMALYYRLPGLLADLALIIYALLTFASFKLIPVTLTLPGIAGFILSIGVAVDANVLIFERMKEEIRSGRTVRQSIDLGFSRAWPSIRDSNFSTLITCAILFWFGNTFGASIVKGFSLTLALGVIASLFTAITVTRTFLHLVLDNIQQVEHPRWFGI